MKRFLLLILFLCISTVACVSNFSIREEPTPAYPDLIILMDRNPCFGACPVYTLLIDGEGNVIYEGKAYVAVEGKRSTKIDPEQIQQLVTAIEKANFFELEDQYRAPVTDLSSISLSITLNGQKKEIWHYGFLDCNGDFDTAPQELCELENKIDEIVNPHQWTE